MRFPPRYQLGALGLQIAKPLGEGFVGVPVTEIRGAALRPFLDRRLSIAANFLIAHGYTGQTTEVLSYPIGTEPLEQVVGVPLKSYVSLSLTYYFSRWYFDLRFEDAHSSPRCPHPNGLPCSLPPLSECPD